MADKNEAQALFDEAPDHEAQSLFDAAPDHVEAAAHNAQAPAPPDPTSLDQKIRSGLQGATYGLGGKLVRNAESVLPDSWNHPVSELIDRATHPKEYTEPLPPAQTDEQNAQMYKDAVADNPGSNIIGSLMAPGPKGITKAKGIVGALANGAFQGGVAGAAQGVGNSEADTLGGVAKDAGEQGLVGAAVGGVLGPVIHGIGGGAKWAGGKFNSVKDLLLAKEAAKLEKPMEAALKEQNSAKDLLKKKIYGEYAASLKKTGTSPDEASKILSANDAQIQDGIESEYRKSLFGKHASEKKDLFTKVRNAEQLGAEWTPEQVEKTVAPAKAQYIQDASAAVDKGLPVPPEKMTPEALKAEILKRGRAAQAKGLKSISTPPPNLDPAMVEDLAQKRLAAQQASGVTKTLPNLHPMQSPDASLTAKGKDALGNLALKAGGSTALGVAGLETPGLGGPVGGAIGMGLGLKGMGAGNDWNNPGLQYLRAKAGEKASNFVENRANDAKGLIAPAVRQADKERMMQLLKLFGASQERPVE